MKPLTMKIKKSIYKLENNRIFKDFRANMIPVNDLGEKLLEGHIRAFQRLILIFYYPN